MKKGQLPVPSPLNTVTALEELPAIFHTWDSNGICLVNFKLHLSKKKISNLLNLRCFFPLPQTVGGFVCLFIIFSLNICLCRNTFIFLKHTSYEPPHLLRKFSRPPKIWRPKSKFPHKASRVLATFLPHFSPFLRPLCFHYPYNLPLLKQAMHFTSLCFCTHTDPSAKNS